MKHIIIGTAGHVDHGKTALIKALTGTDTDRLKEEKDRGISIDLGFAALPLGEDMLAGIVDVPGHERFLKNMLAGTGGIDLVMLVVAADEGVMPQTREHLAMLGLYGVQYGVVVINKIDKVEAEWLDLVEEDVRDLLAETFLAAAPLCRVSAITGTGLIELRQTLLSMAGRVQSRDSAAPFRLWIDRSFTVKGHGTVVTGSLLSGSIAVGDNLTLYPQGSILRVRGLEWHGQKVDQIQAGQRTAINLSGAETENVARGMVLSSPARGMVATQWDVIADWQTEVPVGTRIRLHLGTGEFLGRVYYYKDLPPCYSRLLMESPVGAGLGDRGIIRLYSPQHLLGGVTFIAPARQLRRWAPTRLALAEAMAGKEKHEILAALIADSDQPEVLDDIKRRSGYVADATLERVLAELADAGRVIVMGGYYLAAGTLMALAKNLVETLARQHREQPERAGLSKEIVRQRLGLKERPCEILLDYWQKQDLIVVVEADVALREFASKHEDWRQGLVTRAEIALAAEGLTNIDSMWLAEKLALSPDKARPAIDILLKAAVLVRIGEMLLPRAAIRQVAKTLQRHFAEKATLTVGELRDLLVTSRKVALPLLEYCDQQKLTLRDGDARRPGPRLAETAK